MDYIHIDCNVYYSNDIFINILICDGYSYRIRGIN